MTDDKGAGEGPYGHKKYPIAGGGKKHSQSCQACAYAEGRKAERERWLPQLLSNNTVLFDITSLVGSGKYFDAIELCHAKIFGNNQAIEDNGGTRNAK